MWISFSDDNGCYLWKCFKLFRRTRCRLFDRFRLGITFNDSSSNWIFCLLILGKKFAIVTRRFKAITLIDFLKERYKSHTVVILSAFSIIIFLFSAMAAQWVGGAYLIQLLTGLSYTSALFIFTLTVIIYVVI